MIRAVIICCFVVLATAANLPPTRYEWDSENCGTSKYADAGREQDINARIVGGWEARAHEFPWQISLLWSGSHSCGGWIITENHVVTAAHCTEGYPVGDFKVVVGEHIRGQSNPNKQTIDLAGYVEHPNWDDYTMEGDICVITLAQPITFNEDIQPICPPSLTGKDDYAGYEATVAGWGTTRSPGGGPLSTELKYTNLPIITEAACKDDPFVGRWILDDMICAIPGYNNDRDTCQGDSGGALSAKMADGRFEAIGIVSWGYGCADDVAGVYARVSYYVDWINNQL